MKKIIMKKYKILNFFILKKYKLNYNFSKSIFILAKIILLKIFYFNNLIKG